MKSDIGYIYFSKEYRDKILTGEKVTTIRLGQIPIKEGELYYANCGGEIIGILRVEKVEYKKLKEISKEDAILDGFKSKRKLRRALKKHYKGFNSNSIFTIIHFKLIEKYKDPKRMYTCNDVLSLIRYILQNDDELSNIERQLLNLVLEKGSIRKAAKEINRDKRIFRFIIRESLERLKKKGKLTRTDIARILKDICI